MSKPTYADEKQVDPLYQVAGDEQNGNAPVEVFSALVAEDHKHDIKLRTMSWQKAAWLLAGDQVCLAIMAQTWSLS
ncbi:hypothetical protein FOPE_00897 [Fonsecaea pedrosoi]|nr:hypothetical protein FOPE_00897 [Fonsecaea pedrosoi]